MDYAPQPPVLTTAHRYYHRRYDTMACERCRTKLSFHAHDIEQFSGICNTCWHTRTLH